VVMFDEAEFARRVEIVRGRMQALGVEVLLLDECEALEYLFGAAQSLSFYRAGILPLSESPTMMPRHLDEAPFREASWVGDVRPFADWDDPVVHTAQVLHERGFGGAAIGIDLGSYALGVRRFAGFQVALPGARFIDIGSMIDEVRLVKSEAEVMVLRRASAIADAAMLRAVAAIRPGGTERDPAVAASAAFVELGADTGACGPITSGVGTGFLHGHLHDRPLARHDIVHMELVPRIGGYSARLMRPAVVGAILPRQREVAATIIELQDRQIAAMRTGAAASEVDAIMRKGLLAAGLRTRFDNITGYTLGCYHRAGPRTSDFTRVFAPNADYVLKTGMVFHVYAAADGVAFSESGLVTPAGGERLTRLPRQIFVAGDAV
jgi:Xaa-Pro aminopeptidase